MPGRPPGTGRTPHDANQPLLTQPNPSPLISEHAAALAQAGAAGIVVPTTDTAHVRRVRAALPRDIAVLLGVAPGRGD